MWTIVATEKNQNRSEDRHSYCCMAADDPKPTVGVKNGELCLEMDTGKFYGFDADSEQWVEIGD